MDGKIDYFEIPADDVSRAKKFYSVLFGWKFQELTNEYLRIDAESPIPGGIIKRKRTNQPWTNFITVKDINSISKKVLSLGGKIQLKKVAVNKRGYLAICIDTEGNVFGIWQKDKNAIYP